VTGRMAFTWCTGRCWFL